MSAQTLTDSFTATTVDGTVQVVTITIDGANDAAAISGPVSGSVIEAGGVANGTPGTPTATGDLNATDVGQSGRRLERGRYAAADRQSLRHLYADSDRGVDLHAEQQQCRSCRRSTSVRP